MSYDYERYDGKRIVVDGDIIGLLAMEFGHEVEEVWEEYHAELAMSEEQERQSEAYNESLRRTLSTQYEKVATTEAENAKLRELCADFDKCLDTALYLASEAGYLVMPDQKLFDSLRPRMRELRVEVEESDVSAGLRVEDAKRTQ